MFQPPRGTRDLLPALCAHFRHVSNQAHSVMELYGFQEIETPLFEFSDVFKPVGETSDIVTKETYTFEDRNNQSFTLRPEGTAPIVRAVISNGLAQLAPLKLFYQGPMFRYERPQKGRYRQFYQMGVELMGVDTPIADIEVIALGHQILKTLGLEDRICLEINSLGNIVSRDAYRKALVDYLQDHRAELSEDSQTRLHKNPLRVLDSKADQDKTIVQNAPIYRDYLDNESQDFFAQVLMGLDHLGLKYKRNDRLVRGLDYYGHTAFEFVSTELGAQGTVIGGGRYNGLVKAMGGPDLPAVGWGAGLDRLVLLSKTPPALPSSVVIVPVADENTDKIQTASLQIMQLLRANQISADMGYSGNMSKRLKKAHKKGAETAIIIGTNELETGQYILRNLNTGEQQKLTPHEIIQTLSQKEK